MSIVVNQSELISLIALECRIFLVQCTDDSIGIRLRMHCVLNPVVCNIRTKIAVYSDANDSMIKMYGMRLDGSDT